MKLYMIWTVRLSIIRSLFTVHSAIVYVIQVFRHLSSRILILLESCPPPPPVVSLLPNPQLEGQSTIFVTPGAGWPIYIPRHWVPIVTCYNLHVLQRDCTFPRSPHGENQIPSLCSIVLEVIQSLHYMC